MDYGWQAFFVHVVVTAMMALAALLASRKTITPSLALTICVIAMAPTFWVICSFTNSTVGVNASWIAVGAVVSCYTYTRIED